MKKRICWLILTTVLLLCNIPMPLQAVTTTVRVGYCNQMAPYQQTDHMGQPAGFHIDVMEAISQKAGLLTTYTAFNTTTEAIEALGNGDVDIVLGVPKDQFPGYGVRYTEVVSPANICLVATHEVAAQYREASKRTYLLAVEYSLLEYQYLMAMSANNILQSGNQKSCIEGFLKGRADLLVAVKDCALYYMEQAGCSGQYEIINNYVASADFAIAVRQGDITLCETINNALASLRVSNAYESLHKKWLSIDSDIAYQRLVKNVLIVFCAAVIIIAAYLIISIRTKRKLAMLVAERTAELQDANQKLERGMEQAQAESELRHSIIESSPAGMVLVDEALCIEYMNQNAMRLAGISHYYSDDSILDINFLGSVFQKIGTDLFLEDWSTKSGSMERTAEDCAQRTKEKYRYNIRKLNRFDGRQAALLTVEDITAEEREREAFFEKEKNKTLNNLIAGIAHEIKNPLTTISASADMIQTKGDNAKFREAFSQYIPQEIARITRLINSLIDYARPTRSKIERVHLSEVLQSVFELAKVTAKNTRITLALEQKELTIIGDIDKIKQALFNIVLNSIESIRHNPIPEKERHLIEISAAETNGEVTIRIHDTGIGMSEEELERCTEPFYTTKPAGTGIGLAITKQYIEEIGGVLQITSEKNRFTCVEIHLPVTETIKEEEK